MIRWWGLLLLAQLREQPWRVVVTVAAIALGVALGAAVYLVNGTALDEFGSATKRLVGESDVVVRGPPDGFAESLYPALARDPAVQVASPVLELEAALPGRRETLKVLGIDLFRAAAVQPALFGELGSRVFELLRGDRLFLSASAARQLNLEAGAALEVRVGSQVRKIEVLGILADATYPQALAVMDVGAAQWRFERVGRLNRIDLRLKSGVDATAYRSSLGERLPAGVVAVAPAVERDRAITVTRAYRVNLNMLALVALWTGAFLVFSTQSLSVLRRRRSLAVLRALGVTRGGLEAALVGEGAMLGVVGSALGLLLAVLLAAAILRGLAGDLGNGQLRAFVPGVQARPWPLTFFFLIGTGVAAAGAWVPSRAAARQAPARALKGGDGDHRLAARSQWKAGGALLLLGGGCARLPPVGGLPVFGYAAVALLLFGAVLLVPALTIQILRRAPATRSVVWNCAVAQLRENVGLSTLSLASIIVSFSLMVAMAIMVYSFRVSFVHWLDKLLPADIQMREPLGNDTAYWSPDVQARLAATVGVGRVEFRRTRPLLLDAARSPVTLIARGRDAAATAGELPLVRRAAAAPDGGRPPAWISEALADLYGLESGGVLALPLGGVKREFRIAGVWRDYARAAGSVVVTLPDYVAATGDRSANEGSIWLSGTSGAEAAIAALRAGFAAGDAPEITTSTSVREGSLQIFDRAFVITYALEAIAVAIGLTGISFAAGSTALARRSEFGMLRHVGMLRSQVIGLLGSEGFLLCGFGVLYGLALGVLLSLVLVFVVNRQSFNWSIDLAVPAWQLAALCATLIAAAALTAVWSGRAATGAETVRAVREDW